MVLVGYNQEQHHSFRDFDDCEELRYLTLLVPLSHMVDLYGTVQHSAIRPSSDKLKSPKFTRLPYFDLVTQDFLSLTNHVRQSAMCVQQG